MRDRRGGKLSHGLKALIVDLGSKWEGGGVLTVRICRGKG